MRAHEERRGRVPFDFVVRARNDVSLGNDDGTDWNFVDFGGFLGFLKRQLHESDVVFCEFWGRGGGHAG